MTSPPDHFCIALAQINLSVGDFAANAAAMLAIRAQAQGADVILYPELALVGYPPEDLVMKPALQQAAAQALAELALATADGGPAMLVGTCHVESGKVYNAVALLDAGRIQAITRKHELPNYGVFDEPRTFAPGPLPGPLVVRGVRIGVPICEDMWLPDVCECLAETGAELLLVPNGSPFEVGKESARMTHSVARVVETGLPLAYVNRIGGQDELVFDGGSYVLNADAGMAARLPQWREALALTHWHREAGRWVCARQDIAPEDDDIADIYHAMVLGLRDYVTRNRFPGIVLGMSGGIDSALSAAVAVDALGPDKLWCVMLPSRYTSRDSLDDAQQCAHALGARLETIPIEPAVEAFGAMLDGSFTGKAPDSTEENIQSRVRGLTLMALSNKFGPMVLTTGNKSEMSVGYATLYGDMCGGYSVLKDVYKTTVYRLAEWRNRQVLAGGLGPAGVVIPERILTKAPTAELRADQTDQDSLPPYDILDGILFGLVEEEASAADLVARGFDPATVKRIEHLLFLAEYKRRQSPPGVKIGKRNFGRDRRYPITNAFRSG